MKKVYLSIKFHEDYKNKELIEKLYNSLSEAEFEVLSMVKDIEKYGKLNLVELMKKTFEQINKSDLMVVEFSEKGVGLGIEAGYAHAKGIPIVVIAREGCEISDTLKGITKEIIVYNSPEEVGNLLIEKI